MNTLALALILLGSTSPALAQHAGHSMPMPRPTPTPKATERPTAQATPKPAVKAAPKPAVKAAPKPAGKAAPKPAPTALTVKDKPKSVAPDPPEMQQAMDHGAMDHSAMDHAMPDETMPADDTPTGEFMDNAAMDHSQMDHGAMEHTTVSVPPPAGAGSGPASAADAIWGQEAMRSSREDLKQELGAMNLFWFQGDRAEYRIRDGKNGYLWDLQGYYGGDLDKLWFKSEGEGSFGDEVEAAEIQVLWSHAIAPFFDLQAGVRQDFASMGRTYAVVGVQGLAPFMFEVDAAAFLSDRGDLTARFEAELDQKITQRLILQPRAELKLSAQDVPELGIGAGIDKAGLGLRLRYEFAREFAPYIGAEQEWKLGKSADFARAAGEDASVTNYVVGVRFWF